jgi:branched-chain amino acid transport system substrate-binding protein
MVGYGLLLLGVIAAATGGAVPASAEVRIGVAGPRTGPNAWLGEQTETAAALAVAALNGQGGVLGQTITVVPVDDYCRGDQAVAAAEKLVAAGVVLVVGHQCSGAAIPASEVYERAGILMISNAATNPQLTERGLRHVFRVVGRDDRQGAMAGDYLVEHWAGRKIALVHDGEAYGAGLAAEAKKRLDAGGVQAAVVEQITRGLADYGDVVARLAAAGVEVVYYGGYAPEAGLLIRQSDGAGLAAQYVASDGISTEDFWLIGGPAAEGTLMTSFPDPGAGPAAAEVIAQFRAANIEPFGVMLQSYAAVQVWAQAVEQAGTFAAEALAAALRAAEFDTALGRIGFDAKGDVVGYDTFAWYVWRDGSYVALEPEAAR